MNRPEDQPLPPSSRLDLIEELHARFGSGAAPGIRQRLRFYRKKYVWLMITRGAAAVKRALDISVAAVSLVVLSPLFLVVAAAIKLGDNGRVLFIEKRVGQWGREFTFPKFRSMVINAEELKETLLTQSDHGTGSVTFKMKHDPRITPVGHVIRRLSIDELPQLWCVLIGDISLVGPRPPTIAEVARYTLAERRRLDVKPGLTCFWQVEGRGDIPFHEQLKLDVRYIDSQSLWADLRILLKTIPAVLLGKGAY